VFSKTDFQKWGKDNAVLFAAVMTKIDGRKNDSLLREYGFRGFPSLAILDASGKALTKKVQRNLDSMSSLVKASNRYIELKAKVDAGEGYNKNAWFMTRLDMGQIDVASAKKEMPTLDLSDKQSKRAGNMIFAMELEQMLAKQRAQARRGPRNAAAPRGAAPKLDIPGFVYDAFKAGKRLPKGHGLQAYFDGMLVEAAKKKQDKEAFLFSYPRVRKNIAERIESYKKMVARYANQDNDRAHMMVERINQVVKRSEKELADLDARAEAFKKD